MMVRDMNVCVPPNDQRAIEVFASGLPLHHRAPFAVEITLRCALTTCGCARPNPSHTDRGGDDGPGCLQCLAGGRSPRLWCLLGLKLLMGTTAARQI